MEKLGLIEILIKGKKGKLDFSPDNYDITEIRLILESAEDLLFP